ncbi:putative methyltransferase PMT27 [Hordeum vulgare]|nr:putative methyltransferase PMT27 [Hordeum vulgare]
MALLVAPMALPAADNDNKGNFAMHHVVDTHVRGKDLSVVYTNEPILVESSIQTMEKFLAEDKYQVVGFDLKFSNGRAEKDQKVYQKPNSSFAMMDTTNELRALDVSGLTCQNLVNICDHYKVWGSTNNKQNSLVDLTLAIIDPYYMKAKDESKKDKNARHSAWD